MKYILALVALCASLASAEVSSDGRCGGPSGLTCPGGACCSSQGYCGTSELHCGTGCDSAFGTCEDADSKPTTSRTMSLNRPTGTSTSERMTQAEMGALVQAIAEKLDVTVTPTPTGTRAPMNSTPRPGAANAMARAGIAAAALPVLAALF